MTPESDRPTFDEARQLQAVERAIARHSFCVLATSSAANRPHAVGILYAAVGFDLYLLIGGETIKARNIRENPRVAVSIPVRTIPIPMAPPMAVQYQGTAELLTVDDPEITTLLRDGKLKKITGLGALKAPGVMFVRVRPGRRIASYGIGVSPLSLMRDVTSGARSVEVPHHTQT
jgi:general stress protein 26